MSSKKKKFAIEPGKKYNLEDFKGASMIEIMEAINELSEDFAWYRREYRSFRSEYREAREFVHELSQLRGKKLEKADVMADDFYKGMRNI